MTTKTLSVKVNGKDYIVEVQDIYAAPLTMTIDGKTYTVDLEDDTPGVAAPAPASQPAPTQVRPVVQQAKPSAPVSAPSSSSGPGDVRSPMPGVILDIAVRVGDVVKKGDTLCALEAMKMKSAIRASKDGTISQVEVQNGAKVNHNDLLMVIS